MFCVGVVDEGIVGVSSEGDELEVVLGVVGEVEQEGKVLLVVVLVDDGVGGAEPLLILALYLLLPVAAVLGKLPLQLLLSQLTPEGLAYPCSQALLIGPHYYQSPQKDLKSCL